MIPAVAKRAPSLAAAAAAAAAKPSAAKRALSTVAARAAVARSSGSSLRGSSSLPQQQQQQQQPWQGGGSRRWLSAFKDQYSAHVADRAAEGVVPRPLDAEQVAQLVEMLKAPPADEADFLLDLFVNRVPPGVDEAAYVKAGFLTAVAKREVGCSLISPQYATDRHRLHSSVPRSRSQPAQVNARQKNRSLPRV